MAKKQLRFIAAIAAANFVFLCVAHLSAHAADGPNRVTSSDVAAGRWMDTLLDPDRDVASKKRVSRPRAQQRTSQRRPSLQGKLVRNSGARDGTPPFALVDRYGGILRYVEPSDSVNLQKYLGRTIGVKHDTGDTLLASQLALPRTGRPGAKTGLNLAQHLEPIPAGEIVSPGSATRGPAPHVHNHNHGAHAPPVQEFPAQEFVEEPIVIDGPDNGPIYLDGGHDDGGYEGSYDAGYDSGYRDEGLNFGGCPTCGDVTCGDATCRQRNGGGGGCGLGARGVMYVRGEYLLWNLEGMDIPELVVQVPFDTTANPPVALGTDQSVTLYGGNRVLEDERHGGRIIGGIWLDDYGQWGIEGEYLRLSELEEQFSAGSKNGNSPADGQYIFRPFFNTVSATRDDGSVVPRGNALEDVDTNLLDGTVTVDIRSEFQSAGIRLRHNLCCRSGCDTGCGDGVGCGSGCGNGIGCGSGVGYGSDIGIGPLNRLCNLLRKGTRHTDVLYGFRWTSLDESLQVVEDLQEIPTTAGDEIDVQDRFETENDFLGGEIGYETSWRLRRWSLRLLSKVAIGNTKQRVNISGFTDNDGLNPVRSAGGLLTQSFQLDGQTVNVGNIGTYERDEFSMIPEVGFTLGYNITPRLKLTGGYTLLYWSNILRPGNQIDLDVNGNLLRRDPVLPSNTALVVRDDHPRFEFHQTDLWAQGLNLGAEYTW